MHSGTLEPQPVHILSHLHYFSGKEGKVSQVPKREADNKDASQFIQPE